MFIHHRSDVIHHPDSFPPQSLSLLWDDATQDPAAPLDTQLCEALVNALVAVVVGLRRISRPGDANFASEAITLARACHRRCPQRPVATLASQLHLLRVPLHGPDCLDGPCAPKGRVVALQLQLYNEGDPGASEFGDALMQHGNRLHSSGRYDDACIVKAEAVEMGYVRYEADSSTHSADLASFLDSHGVSLHAAGRYNEACSAKEDAVDIRGKMSELDQRKYRSDMAKSLYSLGTSLHEARLYDDACSAHKKAIPLFRKLYASDPTAYRDDLARCLHCYSISLTETSKLDDHDAHSNKRDAACAASSEAVDLYRTIREPNCADLANYLDQYGITLHSLHRDAEECDAKRRAIVLSRQAYQLDPGANRIDLARHLFSLGRSQDKAMDYQSACTVKAEAIGLLRGLPEEDGRKHSRRLMEYLESYSKTLRRAGQWDHPHAVAQEAVQLR